MKKNILVVQSLLYLPLITPSLSSSMETKPSNMQKQQTKKQNQRQENNKQQNNFLQNQEKKPSYREVVARSLAQAKSIKTYPTVITENNSVNTKPKKETQPEAEKMVILETMQNNEKLLEELKASFAARINPLMEPTNEYHTIPTNSVDLTIVPEAATIQPKHNYTQKTKINYDEFPFLISILECIEEQRVEDQLTNSTKHSSKVEILSNELFQSVILPTEEKGLGFFGTLSYYLGDSIKNIISYLQNNTFETNNASHFKLLNEAIQKAVTNNDFDSLVTIAALCEKEQYRNEIRISDDAAKTSLNFFTTKYTQDITQSNDSLQNKRKNSMDQWYTKSLAFANLLDNAITAYKQDVQNIADDYDTEVDKETKRIALMKESITKFSILNKVMREDTRILTTSHTLEIPKNKCTKLIKQTNSSINLISTLNSRIPEIGAPQQSSNNLQLTDNK